MNALKVGDELWQAEPPIEFRITAIHDYCVIVDELGYPIAVSGNRVPPGHVWQREVLRTHRLTLKYASALRKAYLEREKATEGRGE